MKTMKTLRWMALALVVSVPLLGRAQGPIHADLAPSLKFMQTVTRPMPNFRPVVFYTGIPDSQGRIVDGIGHSTWVRGWFRQMEPMPAKFLASEQKLRLDVNVYTDTVREEGDAVLKAAAGMSQALKSLDTTTLGHVRTLLGKYHDEVKAARDARSRYEVSKKKAEESKFLLEAADNDAKECNLILARSKLEAEKAALLAKIEKSMAFLNAVEKAINAMAGGPTAVAGYIVGEAKSLTSAAMKELIIDAFHSSARETLYEIGMKIEAIDVSLKDVKCKKQEATLRASKANLEATLLQTVLSFGAILDHRAKAWRTVDDLGALKNPKTGGPVAFFVSVKNYNDQVNVMGKTVFDSINAHLELLAKEPLSRGDLILASIDEDVATVEGERAKRDPNGAWLSKAKQTRTYMADYTRWYDGDVRRGQTILENLREGWHLDFVDRMLARAMKDLGGTVSYEHIIR